MTEDQTEHQHETFATVSTADPAKTRALVVDVARLIADNNCEQIVLLDVRDLSQVTDYIVIGTGSSNRQMKTTADEIMDLVAEKDAPVFRRNEDQAATWLVIDCVDFVAHLFEPQTRAHYDLEMLWADAPRLEWARADQERNRAGIDLPGDDG